MPTAAIQVQSVSKAFGGRMVLDAIRLDVIEGETLVILGGSGSGKSTLLRLMIGNERIDDGDIFVAHAGKNLRAMNRVEFDTYRKSVGVLFQSGALFNSMTIAENVALPMREHTEWAEATIDIVVKLKLRQVNLLKQANLMPSQLSGGQKKRAGLARAIALDPKIIFYDEPSAGLDPVTSANIDQLIMDLNSKAGVTSVVVTHEMDSAVRIAHRMVLLHKGKFIASGTPDEMFKNTDPLVYQFVRGLKDGPMTDDNEENEFLDDLMDDKEYPL